MRKILLFFILLLVANNLYAQICIDLNTYNDFVGKGKKLVQEGNYVEAVQYYNSAKDHCPAKGKEVSQLIEQAVTIMQKEKKEAEEARNIAILLEKEAKNAKEVAVANEKKANELALRSQKIANAVSFSPTDHLAIVTGKNNQYGYMDTTGRIVIDCQYSHATHFNFGVAYVNQEDVINRLGTVIGGDIKYEKDIESILNDNIKLYPNLDSVKILDFSNFNLSYIPYNFDLLKNLHTIYLANNPEIGLKNTGFSNIKNIKVLNISNNPYFHKLPKDLSELNLDELYVDNTINAKLRFSQGANKIGKNFIKFFIVLNAVISSNPYFFISFPFIVYSIMLDLSPRYIGLFKFKYKMSLKNLSNQQNLRILSISNGRISGLSRHVSMLSSLEELNVSNNFFRKVHNNLITLSNLKKMNISHNRIRKINKNIHLLKNLEELNISYNKLKKLPDSIIMPAKLKKLDLQGNRFYKEERERIKKHCLIAK